MGKHRPDMGAAQSLDELCDYGLGWDGYKRTASELEHREKLHHS